MALKIQFNLDYSNFTTCLFDFATIAKFFVLKVDFRLQIKYIIFICTS